MIDVTLKGRTGTAAAPFYALAVERVTFLGDNVPVDGETVAILSPDGDTLALGYADGGAVDLNLNTAEADGATAYLEPTETIRAALVVGDTDNVRAIVGIDLGRNMLDELAPPPELAPKYPTSAELLAILSQMTAQAQRAEESVEATERAQKAVAEYVDNTFPTKVEQAEESLANATTKGVQAVTDKASQSVNSITAHTTTIISALDSKKTQIETSIDTKAQEVNTALDTKLATANTAINDAVGKAETAKGDAVKAQSEASKSAEQASTSASNASKSATASAQSEANAKASAVQAENATALKVDQRINQSDNSPYPLVVRVDKDVYKLVAPKDASNSWHYCCDGVAHYFAKYPSQLYVYDGGLKFVEALQVSYGESISSAELYLKDFCTKIGDNYFIRWNAYPYNVHKIRKYDKSGAFVKEVVIDGIAQYNAFTRVARNERTNHLLIFSNYPDGVGYKIYDEDLTFLGEKRIDAKIGSGDNWLRHLNVVGGFTLVSFAPTDATKTALFILDENDDIQEVTAVTIRGSGAFTSEDLTASGRTSANYFVPRMFYDMRSAYGQFNRHHVVDVTNGAKWYRIYVDSNAESLGEISADSYFFNAIKVSSVPQTKYAEDTLFVANGTGTNSGGNTYSQPVVNLTSNGILTKVADLYDARNGFTEFAPDPFASIAIFGRRVIGNTRLARNDVATSRTYNLYPANDGAVMFTP